MKQNVACSKKELVHYINNILINHVGELEHETECLKEENSKLKTENKKFRESLELSSWTKEDAQRDGGGFTEEEILNSQTENW